MTDSGPHGSSRSTLLLLAFTTGFAGLGSETTFFKVLDFTLGSAPLVSFTVVSVFILGMGLGALCSPRVQRPWIAEALLAAYDLAFIFGFDGVRAGLGIAVSKLAPLIGVNGASACLAFLTVLPAAVLLGIAFPAIAEHEAEVPKPFTWNALGAACGIVLVEALLFPRFGVRGCLAVLAAIHFLSAALLFRRVQKIESLQIEKPVLVLGVVGIATGAFQGVWLLVGQLLLQPFYFVQPVIVATMISGLFLGSAIWRSLRWSFTRTLFACLCGAALSAVWIVTWLELPQATTAIRGALEIPFVLLPLAVPLGAIVPSYFGTRFVSRSELGAATLSIACGNALGIMFAGAVLASITTVTWALFVAAFVLGVVIVIGGPRRWLPVLPLALLFAIGLHVKDEDFISRLPEHYDQSVVLHHLFRGPGELTAVYSRLNPHTKRVERRLYQTGFSPIYLDRSTEGLITAVGAAYAKKHDRVLVLGAGSGISASAGAELFRECDVVDVGHTVPALMKALAPLNRNVFEKGNVHYHEIDAIIAPYALPGRYDLVVLTIDPAYHAKAAKLYTVELFRAIEGMLAPGGIFVFWSDFQLDREANQILINTGRAVFKEQKLFSAFPLPKDRKQLSYYFLVHGDAALEYDPGNAMLATRLKDDLAVLELPGASDESSRLIVGRASESERVHSLASPAAELLFGGYHDGPIKTFLP